MIRKSPSGALSPYYYKGGYFHGIHYGSYFNQTESLLAIMQQEEAYILRAPDRRRILIDLYDTTLPDSVLEQFVQHIQRLSPKIVKLAIASDPKSLKRLRRALRKAEGLEYGQLYFCTDMEAGKTWLVCDE